MLLVFSLILLPLVYAAPPQASAAEYGFDVRSGVSNNIPLNQDYDFHVHIFNSSNGVPIIENAGCYFHLYNVNGKHIYEGYDGEVSHDFDFGFDVDKGNFSRIGEFEYIIQCNNTESGGFISGNFHVTETGHPEKGGAVIVFLMILGLVAFFFLLWTLINTLEAFASLEINFKVISWSFAAYFTNLAYYYYLKMFMPMNLMLDLSFIGISAFGMTHLFLPLVGLIISWIKGGKVE